MEVIAPAGVELEDRFVSTLLDWCPLMSNISNTFLIYSAYPCRLAVLLR